MNLAELHARLGETEVNLEMASRREDEQAARIEAQDVELKRLRALRDAMLRHGGWDRKTSPGAVLMDLIDDERRIACGCSGCLSVTACRAAKTAPEVKP